jgi:hypothetical protein
MGIDGKSHLPENRDSHVFRFAYDPNSAVLVVVHTVGAFREELMADYQRALLVLDADAVALPTAAVTIFVVEPGAVRPNAKQRQAFADVWNSTRAPLHLFALVTTSAVDRAIMKLISWLHAVPKKRQSIHSTFAEAAEWACRERGAPIPVLPSLYERVRTSCPPGEASREVS